MTDNKGYIVVTDYVEVNSGKDVSDALQELVLANPQKTIFFPDGEYLLAKPLCTPANPAHAVSLKLSDFAIIRPTADWDSDEALIRLGAAEPWNDIDTAGSYYGIMGGVIDGCGIAKAISIDSGRETYVRDLSIKGAQVGIHIKKGANSGSSDSDVRDVNIVGNNKADSIGVLVEGFDNTFANMRIASVHIGIWINGSAGNCLRNLHPLYIFCGENASDENYRTSIAFKDTGWNNNWYENCYSDQFATGFWSGEGRHIYHDCFTMWYTPRGGKQVGFYFDGKFNSIIRTSTVEFHPNVDSSYLTCTADGGVGYIENPIFWDNSCANKQYKDYLKGQVISC